ncbi:hypothetical protein EV182_002776, partial [Spiromyces aspiralis]
NNSKGHRPGSSSGQAEEGEQVGYDSWSSSEEDNYGNGMSANSTASPGAETSSLPDEEDVEDYRKGGYHPIVLGDKFKDGRYTIVRKLGWGHFSTVWLAYDRDRDIHVALKVVKSAQHYTEAAKDEVKLCSRVASASTSHFGHGHVVELLDDFEHSGPHGRHVCMVFEVLGENLLSLLRNADHYHSLSAAVDAARSGTNTVGEGQTVSQHHPPSAGSSGEARHSTSSSSSSSKVRGLPVPLVKKISRQILRGLAYLHGPCGIIHTDLKPENVLVCIDDVEEVIRKELSQHQLEVEEKERKRREQPLQLPQQKRRETDLRQSVANGGTASSSQRSRKLIHESWSVASSAAVSRVPSSIEASPEPPASVTEGVTYSVLSANGGSQPRANDNKRTSLSQLRSLERNLTGISITEKSSCCQGSLPSPPHDDCHRPFGPQDEFGGEGSSSGSGGDDSGQDGINDSQHNHQSVLIPTTSSSNHTIALHDAEHGSHNSGHGPKAQADGKAIKNGGAAATSSDRQPVTPPTSADAQDQCRSATEPTTSTVHRRSTSRQTGSSSSGGGGQRGLRVKLADLGNATWKERHFTEDIQTRQYRSPEVIIGAPWDETADIWSCACLIFELLTGEYLFEPHSGDRFDKDEDHLAQIIETLGPIPRKFALSGRYSSDFFNRHGQLRHIPRLNPLYLEDLLFEEYGFSRSEANNLASFLLPMLAINPRSRITAEQALRHPWLYN